MFFESEIPQKVDDDIDNQITKDICTGESSNNFETFDINVLQQNSGMLHIFSLSNDLLFIVNHKNIDINISRYRLRCY